ncbi:phosphatidylinositol-glycan biosynthesis class X protein isoform X2 [Nematostella vectensis]|uniref:phosphatidylinositol-glycan biosynthesis class X protein isoform X2 n=1 Tax=Nematostella vectensis TaxID=45351 RepID=UPI002076E4AA|nr:phosphatidylinositol-glycan biosynthesis class X protein isoform X2 [Nematostella vectensis]
MATKVALLMLVLLFYIEGCLSLKGTFHVCENLGLWEVERSLEKTGFHRLLTTRVLLNQEFIGHDCELVYMEDLPPDVYVDMDELRNRAEFGEPKVLSNSSINVELPASLASAHYLWVFPQIRKEFSEVTIQMPVHLRYQKPMTSRSTVYLSLRPPQLYLRCSEPPVVDCATVAGPCASDDHNSCQLYPLKTDSISNSRSLPRIQGKK